MFNGPIRVVNVGSFINATTIGHPSDLALAHASKFVLSSSVTASTVSVFDIFASSKSSISKPSPCKTIVRSN